MPLDLMDIHSFHCHMVNEVKMLLLLRLRETQNALQLPVFFLFFCQPYPEFRGAKNYFTDNRTANTIHGFRDSVPILKIHGCY